MFPILSAIFFTMAGICLYSGVAHLTAAQHYRQPQQHQLFGGVALLLVGFTIFHVRALGAEDVATFAIALKWSLTLMLLAVLLLLWFFACYTENTSRRSRLWLWVISGALLVSIAANMASPYSLQFTAIEELARVRGPWGDEIARATGSANPWAYFACAAWLGGMAYILQALKRRKRDRRGARLMSVVVWLYVIASAYGTLFRLGVLPGFSLGAMPFLGMTIAMGGMLERDAARRQRASEHRLRALFDQSPLGIQTLTPDGRTIEVNDAWKQLWGRSRDAVASIDIRHDPSHIHAGVVPDLERGLSGLPTELPVAAYTTIHPKTGKERQRWIRGQIYAIQGRDGRPREAVVIHEDVTAQKYAEEAIHCIATGMDGGDRFFERLVENLAVLFQTDHALIGLLCENSSLDSRTIDAFAVWSDGQIVQGVPYELAGTPCEQVLEQSPCIYSERVREQFPNVPPLEALEAESYIGVRITDSSGHIWGVMAAAGRQPLDHDRRTREILEIFAARAGEELRRLRDEGHIRRMAYEDYLTKLPNRAQFHEKLAEALERARDRGATGALLTLDLDRFKTINDALGHDVGDALLAAVARHLKRVAAPNIFVARLGGDEFVVLLESDAPDREALEREALNLANRIAAMLAGSMWVGERQLNTGTSIGVALFPEGGATQSELMRHSDMALYRAKQLGRGLVQLYHPSLQVNATHRLHLEEGLRTAIANQQLELHFQPQVDDRGRAAGAEALLRWNHPEFGNVSPTVFVPLAEEVGAIHEIGRWVLDRACGQLSQWLADGVPFCGHLSINVCPAQFSHVDFVEQVRDTLSRFALESRYITLELTETALLQDIPGTIVKLEALRSMGIQVALDDFGTGYSSLAYLKDLPLDWLKIDRAFINELGDQSKQCLAETIVAIGQLMDLKTIAEGVETDEQHRTLVGYGCPYFQGYLFGRPLPEAEFRTWAIDNALRAEAVSKYTAMRAV